MEDVDKLGRAGQIKDVSGGYARNFLLHKGLAKAATKQSLHELEVKKSKKQKTIEKVQQKSDQLVQELQGARVAVKAKASDSGKLYGSVGNKEIVQALNAQLKSKGMVQRVESQQVVLDQPIKQTGEKDVVVHMAPEKEVKIKLVVESA